MASAAVVPAAQAQDTEELNTKAVLQPGQEEDTQGGYKFRIGGYGEMLANWKDYGLNRWNGTLAGNAKRHHAEISIPRFIIAMDYKFSPKWILSSEIEFEAGGTGTEYEIEKGSGSENGEYETETETGGEVALEQFHITRLIIPEFNVRAGHMIVPVGLTNTHHEPINFFGTSRPEGETTMLPSTWHETGLEFFGNFGRGLAKFDYEAMVIAGPNPNGFDKYNWIKKGKQNYFETDNFTSPAYVFRLNWTGVPGLRLGGAFYYCDNAGKNADKLITYKAYGQIPVRIWSFDGQYVGKYLTARANIITGNLAHANDISAANRLYSSKSPYDRTPLVAKCALTYSAELGINLKSFFPNVEHFPVIYPFAHYTYYNTQEKGETGTLQIGSNTYTLDDRCQVSKWTVGLNWKPLPNLVVKADYNTRQIGTRKIFGTGKYNSENEWAVGVAYIGWFFKK